MKTIGDLLKEARNARGFSKKELGEMTHIKVSFIHALENDDWGNLPEFSTTIGNGVGFTNINQTPPTRLFGANVTLTF